MMKIRQGDRFLYEGNICSYIASLSLETVQLYNVKKKVYIEVKIEDLQPVPESDNSDISTDDVLSASVEEWEIAEYRYRSIQDFLIQDKAIRKISDLKEKLNLSQSRCYSLLNSFDEEHGPSSLLRKIRGRKAGAKHLKEQVESIIQYSIKDTWKGPGARIKGVYNDVKEKCYRAAIPPPSYKAVRARLKEIKSSTLVRLRDGSKKANDLFQPRTKQLNVSAPLHFWQMDHCVIDCVVVDEIHRKALCRPWATIIIDVYSRVIVGFYLSLHAPNSYSVAMAISHAVMPKERWIAALGDDDLFCPYYGTPKVIAMDNAKEFISRTLKVAALKHNIQLSWRPKGKAWWGGHIERLNGTLAMSYIHFLPGTTLSNVILRGEYDSNKHACLTFSEFRLWFARAVQMYHNTEHRRLEGMTPHEKWIAGLTRKSGELEHPKLLDNPEEFVLDFLPQKERVITREGIQIWGLFYWESSLSAYVSKSQKQVVKYNPLSLRHVWVNPTGKRYIKVPYKDITKPDISLEELKVAKRQEQNFASSEGRAARARSRTDAVFFMAQKNRELVEAAKANTRTSKKIYENKKQSAFFEQAIGTDTGESNFGSEIHPDTYDDTPMTFPVEVE
ncbi:Mu transposase C-terminal domain-containing protein [Pseudomonas marincola]|uniref:Mu transposase C-terminal domain-containing protein n=1 Tax=Pseudomonas marincola TaxID=437900 RepID=UPI0008ED5CD3|nr:DDE-type integrase/transposase/recombinase [Pseudomonas marincola]SFU20543.1 putative transposase [Pseudomonas marincola]